MTQKTLSILGAIKKKIENLDRNSKSNAQDLSSEFDYVISNKSSSSSNQIPANNNSSNSQDANSESKTSTSENNQSITGQQNVKDITSNNSSETSNLNDQKTNQTNLDSSLNAINSDENLDIDYDEIIEEYEDLINDEDIDGGQTLKIVNDNIDNKDLEPNFTNHQQTNDNSTALDKDPKNLNNQQNDFNFSNELIFEDEKLSLTNQTNTMNNPQRKIKDNEDLNFNIEIPSLGDFADNKSLYSKISSAKNNVKSTKDDATNIPSVDQAIPNLSLTTEEKSEHISNESLNLDFDLNFSDHPNEEDHPIESDLQISNSSDSLDFSMGFNQNNIPTSTINDNKKTQENINEDSNLVKKKEMVIDFENELLTQSQANDNLTKQEDEKSDLGNQNNNLDYQKTNDINNINTTDTSSYLTYQDDDLESATAKIFGDVKNYDKIENISTKIDINSKEDITSPNNQNKINPVDNFQSNINQVDSNNSSEVKSNQLKFEDNSNSIDPNNIANKNYLNNSYSVSNQKNFFDVSNNSSSTDIFNFNNEVSSVNNLNTQANYELFTNVNLIDQKSNNQNSAVSINGNNNPSQYQFNVSKPLIDENVILKTNQEISKLISTKEIINGVSNFMESSYPIEIAVQLMEPKLEQWLNENLGAIVEKIVREEISKMISK